MSSDFIFFFVCVCDRLIESKASVCARAKYRLRRPQRHQRWRQQKQVDSNRNSNNNIQPINKEIYRVIISISVLILLKNCVSVYFSSLLLLLLLLLKSNDVRELTITFSQAISFFFAMPFGAHVPLFKRFLIVGCGCCCCYRVNIYIRMSSSVSLSPSS